MDLEIWARVIPEGMQATHVYVTSAPHALGHHQVPGCTSRAATACDANIAMETRDEFIAELRRLAEGAGHRVVLVNYRGDGGDRTDWYGC